MTTVNATDDAKDNHAKDNHAKDTGKVNRGLLILLVVLPLAAAYYARACPCDRIPGLWVFGETAAEPVTDWSFANKPGLCQLQVSGTLPHSLNLNCMADEKRLFVSCSNCEGKSWSSYALADPAGWIKIDGVRYPVQLRRVQDSNRLDKVWRARLQKISQDTAKPRPDHWWSFELSSRSI